jgi:ribonuclease HII
MSKWPLMTAGVDEAGRGPLAGPVVVSAVILNPQRRINGLADSKVLTPDRRETLAARIRERAIAFSVVVIDVEHIDRLNIFHATMLGMTRAVEALNPQPELALIDGNHAPKTIAVNKRAIVDGDALEYCISAASILAKTVRDASGIRVRIAQGLFDARAFCGAEQTWTLSDPSAEFCAGAGLRDGGFVFG